MSDPGQGDGRQFNAAAILVPDRPGSVPGHKQLCRALPLTEQMWGMKTGDLELPWTQRGAPSRNSNSQTSQERSPAGHLKGRPSSWDAEELGKPS